MNADHNNPKSVSLLARAQRREVYRQEMKRYSSESWDYITAATQLNIMDIEDQRDEYYEKLEAEREKTEALQARINRPRCAIDGKFHSEGLSLVMARLDGWTEDTSPETENSKHFWWWDDSKMVRKIQGDLAAQYCDAPLAKDVAETAEWLVSCDADAHAGRFIKACNAYDADKARIGALERALGACLIILDEGEPQAAGLDGVRLSDEAQQKRNTFWSRHESASQTARKLLADAKEKA